MVTFGLFADLHYSLPGTASRGNGFRALDDLKQGLARFTNHSVDFALSLGDNTHDAPDKAGQIKAMSNIATAMKEAPYPTFLCAGNHEFTQLTPEENFRIFGISSFYYSFEKNGIRFIVLDTNIMPDGVHYSEGNFDWSKCILDEKQLDWLKKELSVKKPTVIFAHGNIARRYVNQYDDWYLLINHAEIMKMITDSGCVLGVFQGHHHDRSFYEEEGILFYNVASPASRDAYSPLDFPVYQIDDNGKITEIE